MSGGGGPPVGRLLLQASALRQRAAPRSAPAPSVCRPVRLPSRPSPVPRIFARFRRKSGFPTFVRTSLRIGMSSGSCLSAVSPRAAPPPWIAPNGSALKDRPCGSARRRRFGPVRGPHGRLAVSVFPEKRRRSIICSQAVNRALRAKRDGTKRMNRGRMERGRMERGRLERGRLERGRMERGRLERDRPGWRARGGTRGGRQLRFSGKNGDDQPQGGRPRAPVPGGDGGVDSGRPGAERQPPPRGPQRPEADAASRLGSSPARPALKPVSSGIRIPDAR